tara:strand:+ start:2746 stop:3213 length:468 start_codon:yes stop_codon:yes gene_type:complete
VRPFSAAVNENNAVVATAFGTSDALRKRVKGCHLLVDVERLAKVKRQVEEYFWGKRRCFTLKLAPAGTPFQHSVWDALVEIPYGETASYMQIAKSIGRPKAARAVGRANGTNPICLIVPCHRVIGADGSLTGFAFGEKIKEKLLRHEGALTTGLV